MILVIDTTERTKITLGLFNKGILNCFEFTTEKQSEDLLVAIDGVLKKQKIDLKSLTGILANLGHGSFTGIRVGVTVANTLAWILDIPVFGFKKENLDQDLANISQNKLKNFSKPLIPYYS